MVNKVTPLRNARMKDTSNKWFELEIAEKLIVRVNFFKKFKPSRLNVDWEIRKDARNEVKNGSKMRKEMFWGKTNGKYNKTKRSFENVIISETTKQQIYA